MSKKRVNILRAILIILLGFAGGYIVDDISNKPFPIASIVLPIMSVLIAVWVLGINKE